MRQSLKPSTRWEEQPVSSTQPTLHLLPRTHAPRSFCRSFDMRVSEYDLAATSSLSTGANNSNDSASSALRATISSSAHTAGGGYTLRAEGKPIAGGEGLTHRRGRPPLQSCLATKNSLLRQPRPAGLRRAAPMHGAAVAPSTVGVHGPSRRRLRSHFTGRIRSKGRSRHPMGWRDAPSDFAAVSAAGRGIRFTCVCVVGTCT